GKSKAVFDQGFADLADIGFAQGGRARGHDRRRIPRHLGPVRPFWREPTSRRPPCDSSPFDEMVDITDDIERAKRFAGDHYLDPAARIGLDYHQVEATKRLWAEAGRGMFHFDPVMAAIPEDYDGDYMIEVVEPSVDSLYNSFKNGFRWARYALGL